MADGNNGTPVGVQYRPMSDKEWGFHSRRKDLKELEGRLVAKALELLEAKEQALREADSRVASARAEVESLKEALAKSRDGKVLVVHRSFSDALEVYTENVQVESIEITRWQDGYRQEMVERKLEALGEPWDRIYRPENQRKFIRVRDWGRKIILARLKDTV